MKIILLLFFVLLLAVNLPAQKIIYTNVSPDRYVGAGDSFLLDINNDSYDDFKIFQYSSTVTPIYDMVGIRPKWYNQVLGDPAASYFYPKALRWGDSINGNLTTWRGDIGYGMSMNYQTSSTDYGNWQGGVTNYYLGLRISFSSRWYYGWVRLDVAADGKSFVVKDYAYDTISYQGLKAAEGLPSSIKPDNSLQNITVFVNEGDLLIDSRKAGIEHFDFEILNLYGQVLKKGLNASGLFSTDLSGFEKGIYILKINADNKSRSLKFWY